MLMLLIVGLVVAVVVALVDQTERLNRLCC